MPNLATLGQIGINNQFGGMNGNYQGYQMGMNNNLGQMNFQPQQQMNPFSPPGMGVGIYNPQQFPQSVNMRSSMNFPQNMPLQNFNSGHPQFDLNQPQQQPFFNNNNMNFNQNNFDGINNSNNNNEKLRGRVGNQNNNNQNIPVS